jgi:hypothetical protein
MGFVQQITVTTSPADPSAYTVGPFALTVHPSSAADRVTLVTNPALIHYEDGGITGAFKGHVIGFATTDESKKIELSKAEPERAVVVSMGRYRFHLLRCHEVTHEGLKFPAYDLLVSSLDDDEKTDEQTEAMRMWAEAWALHQSGAAKAQEAIAAYERLVRRFTGVGIAEQDEDVARSVVSAHINMGAIQAGVGRWKDAVKRYDGALSVSSVDQPEMLLDLTAIALRAKAQAQYAIGEKDLSRKTAEELIARGERSTNDQTQRIVAETRKILESWS